MGNEICCVREDRSKREELIIREEGPDESLVAYKVELTTSRAVKNPNMMVHNENPDKQNFEFTFNDNVEKPKEENKTNVDNHDEESIKKINQVRFIQKFMKNIFCIDEKTSFYNNKKSSFVKNFENKNISIYFAPRVIEVDSKLENFYTISLEKFPQLYKSCRTLMKLPPVVTENQEVYLGSWNYLTGKFHGYGVLATKDGSKLEGFWLEGLHHYYGRVILANGDYYEGGIKYGSFNGVGTFSHYTGGTYFGEWQDHLMHGQGEEFFVDGSKFKGEFRNGTKNGNGKFTWCDGSTYEGEVKDNAIEGVGEYRWVEGNYYKGNFKNGVFDGYGVYIYADGKKYEGFYKNNVREGQGKYTWNEKKFYQGQWKNGVQDGEGVYHNEGKITKGIWSEGKLSRSIEVIQDSNYQTL